MSRVNTSWTVMSSSMHRQFKMWFDYILLSNPTCRKSEQSKRLAVERRMHYAYIHIIMAELAFYNQILDAVRCIANEQV